MAAYLNMHLIIVVVYSCTTCFIWEHIRESFLIGETKQSDSIGMRGRQRDGWSACVVMQNESEVKRLRISGSPSTLNAEPNVEQILWGFASASH